MAAAGYENILLDGGHEFRDLNAQQLDDYIRVIADTAKYNTLLTDGQVYLLRIKN